MNVRKVVAGSAFDAGWGVAGMFGAGTAFAAFGVSYDRHEEDEEDEQHG